MKIQRQALHKPRPRFEKQLSEAVTLIGDGDTTDNRRLRAQLKEEARELARTSTMSVPEALTMVTGRHILEGIKSGRIEMEDE